MVLHLSLWKPRIGEKTVFEFTAGGIFLKLNIIKHNVRIANSFFK